MKTIVVGLNLESVEAAKRALLEEKKVLTKQAIPEFLTRAAEWIKEEANLLLDLSDIGANVKADIQSRWYIRKVSNNHFILQNSSWKSAFVEFGIGIVGDTQQHPNASKADYKYDVDSLYKNKERGWQFSVDENADLDIPESAVIERATLDDGMLIYTKGTKGVWYLFNAMENFKLRRAASLWAEIKQQYWG